MRGFFDELRRRKVSRTAVVYAVVAWAVIESSSVIFPALHLPEWTVTFIVVIALLGFPVTLIFAWVFDFTREGIVRTPDRADISPEQAATIGRGRLFDFVIIAVLLGVIGWLGWERMSDRAAGPDHAGFNSIAVLPFANMSGDPENEYFGDGLAEDLLNALVRVEGLRVAARTSSFEYKGQHGDVRRIGEALGVSTILEGSVRKAGDRVRVTAQLVRADDGFHLWSETYDRQLQDIFAVQDEISLAIVDALRVTLGAAERERLVERPTVNVEAYEAYLRGRFEMHKRSPGSLQRAVEEFREAIRQDPDYAAAYSGLADSWMLRRTYGGITSDEALRQAEPMARRALQLAPELAEAHASWGLILQGRGDIEGSIEPLRRAIELNPSYSVAYHWLSLAYSASGRVQESTEVLRRALEIDPEYLTGRRVLLGHLRDLGEHAEADALARDLERQHGSDALVLHTLAGDAMTGGDLLRAIQLSIRAAKLEPSAAHVRLLLVNQLVELGELERAEKQLQIAARHAPDFPALQLWPAQRAFAEGDTDAAIRAVQEYVAAAPDGLDRATNTCMIYGGMGGEAAAHALQHCGAVLRYLGWEPGGALPAAGVDPAALMVASATELGDQDTVEMLKPLLEAEITKFRESGFDPVRIEEFQAILQMITGDPEPFLDGLPRWVRHRWISAYQLETHAFYASVRNEPRFRDMVRQVEERDEAVRAEVGRLSMPD